MNKLLFAGAALLSLTGCISPQNMTAVENAVQTFYHREEQGQAELIYNDASQIFRDATTLADTERLVQLANTAAKGCGAPTRDPSAINTNASTSGYTVGVLYHRSCTGGQLDESFVFRFENNAPKLAGYHIAGGALLAVLMPAAPAAAADTSTSTATTTATSTATTTSTTTAAAKPETKP